MHLVLLFGLATVSMSQVRERQRWILVCVVTLIMAITAVSS